MSHKHITYFTLLLLAMLVVACSADVSDSGGKDGTQVLVGEPVVFAVSFGGEQATRASTMDNLWPEGTVVTISNGTTKYNFTVGTSPSTSSIVATQLAPVGDDNFIWPTTEPNWSFSGWYPAGDEAPSGVEVAANQTVYDESTNPTGITESVYQGYDKLYCPPTPTILRQKPVKLTFLHQVARVVVIINSSYTETKETVTKVEFGGDKVALTGTINTLGTTGANGATTWNVNTADQLNTITMRPNTAMTDTPNNVYAFECILPPQSSSASVTNLIKIASTGNSGAVNRTYNYHAAFNMQAGYQYTYNLLISEQGNITLATVRVTNWSTGDPVTNTATIPDSSYPNTTIE